MTYKKISFIISTIVLSMKRNTQTIPLKRIEKTRVIYHKKNYGKNKPIHDYSYIAEGLLAEGLLAEVSSLFVKVTFKIA